MQRIPSGRACWPVGFYRFDYEEGQRCFSSLSHKEGLVQHQDNGTSKWHVKLTRLCAIIQAFDLTNVFVPSSTSANTSTFLHPLFFFFFIRFTSPNENRMGEKEKEQKDFGGEKQKKISSCWRENVRHADKFGCLAFVV